jgi:hypothetical protein
MYRLDVVRLFFHLFFYSFVKADFTSGLLRWGGLVFWGIFYLVFYFLRQTLES